MSMIGFPLLLIPLAILNIIVFLMPGVSFTDPVFTVMLMSKAAWKITFGDGLLAFSFLLLLFEVIKAARPGGKYVTDHLLALLVFAGAAAEFLLLPQFATSVFFLLTALTLVDFIAGISLRLRRDRPRRAESPKASPAPTPVQAPAEPRIEVGPRIEPSLQVAPEPRVEPAQTVPPMVTVEPVQRGGYTAGNPEAGAPPVAPGDHPPR